MKWFAFKWPRPCFVVVGFKKVRDLWKIWSSSVIAFFNTECVHKFYVHVKKFKTVDYGICEIILLATRKAHKLACSQVIYPYKAV